MEDSFGVKFKNVCGALVTNNMCQMWRMYYHTSLASTGLSILLYNNPQNFETSLHGDKKLQLVHFKHLTAGINFVSTVMKIIMVL